MGRGRDTGRDGDTGEQALVFLLGAAGGFAVGMLLSGTFPAPAEPTREVGSRLRRTAATMARSLRPGRLRREQREQEALTRVEDAVLDAFLHDEVLSERPIDIGAVSRGMIELSGSVRTGDEAERAVRLARRVEGVETVINRMDVEDELSRRRRGSGTESGGIMGGEWTGREIGMGRRRQGHETEPDRPDDSQHQKEVALEQADRAQFEDEGLGHSQPRMSARPGPAGDPLDRVNYDEDELDNQSPYGKHAVSVPEQPQALNADARVGEGPKPGTELALEAADLPVKPHSRSRPAEPDSGNR